MKCVICGMEVESIEDAIDQGWVPYFYDHRFSCQIKAPKI